MSDAFWNGIIRQHADAQVRASEPVTHDTYRGWLIEQNWLGEFEATHPDFDPAPVHLYDGPSDNRWVSSKTRVGVIDEIDTWIEENDQ